jgi:hypothetical protein
MTCYVEASRFGPDSKGGRQGDTRSNHLAWRQALTATRRRKRSGSVSAGKLKADYERDRPAAVFLKSANFISKAWTWLNLLMGDVARAILNLHETITRS